jgi:hypothetical protein
LAIAARAYKTCWALHGGFSAAPLSLVAMNRARPIPAALATGSTFRWGLRERVAAALAALVVAATVALSLLLAQHARQSHLSLAADNVDALASQMARELSHGMDRFTREVQLQAGSPAFSDAAASPESMRRALEQIQRVYPEFAYLSVVDVASAKVVAATGGPPAQARIRRAAALPGRGGSDRRARRKGRARARGAP